MGLGGSECPASWEQLLGAGVEGAVGRAQWTVLFQTLPVDTVTLPRSPALQNTVPEP